MLVFAIMSNVIDANFLCTRFPFIFDITMKFCQIEWNELPIVEFVERKKWLHEPFPFVMSFMLLICADFSHFLSVSVFVTLFYWRAHFSSLWTRLIPKSSSVVIFIVVSSLREASEMDLCSVLRVTRNHDILSYTHILSKWCNFIYRVEKMHNAFLYFNIINTYTCTQTHTHKLSLIQKE